MVKQGKTNLSLCLTRHCDIHTYEVAQLAGALRYNPEGRGIDSCRFRGRRGLRRGSVSARLLGLQVRIPPRACFCCVCSTVKTKGKSQDSQDKEKSAEKCKERTRKGIQKTKKKKIRWGCLKFFVEFILPTALWLLCRLSL